MLCVQFLLPSFILLFAHIRIYKKLTSLPFWGRSRHHVASEDTELQTVAGENHNHEKDEKRKGARRKNGNKTIYLLMCVVTIFMISWFPLNVLNVLLDLGFYSRLFRFVLTRFYLMFIFVLFQHDLLT